MKLPTVLTLKQLHWWPALVASILGAASLSACLWAWTEWGSVRGALAEQRALFIRSQQLVGQHRRVEAAVQAYGDYLTVSGSDNEAAQHLLTLVEQLATRAGVQLVSIKPRLAQHDAETAEYSVELECSAPVTALIQFIHAVEYGPALLHITRVRINPALRDPARLDAQLLITYTNLL